MYKVSYKNNVECWDIKKIHGDPSYTHLKVLKRILRYVRGTLSLGLFYSKSDDYRSVGYSDSDWCCDVDDRKSTSGYVFLLGNTNFTWLSKKQPIVTLSTCEVEYVVATWSNNDGIGRTSLDVDAMNVATAHGGIPNQ
ncbi:secreted RxLR effector protein 161-like [Impatiens glandulifera]|uniref:secreted RxLR effector protein 161-like n=1 Tax=Impatiens glandulifera TaxID=253017 RepID=UPI001FB0AF62|nr:secreted RxLR effector protein 161-like [Impatiens glandulifera]